MRGYIREIFTSIQGEGIKVGQRQTFIRCLGCNLSCNYCDTPETQKMRGPFMYEGKSFKNPVDIDRIIEKITEPEVAITGGEPLLQIDFLLELCRKLNMSGKKIYLDTNATLPRELTKIKRYLNIISLDFKIPSATGMPKLWEKHKACLIAAQPKDVFVKMVINENILPGEIDHACNIIANVNINIPLVIQPVFGQQIPAILDIQKRALTRLADVRIIPQVHKYLGLV